MIWVGWDIVWVTWNVKYKDKRHKVKVLIDRDFLGFQLMEQLSDLHFVEFDKCNTEIPMCQTGAGPPTLRMRYFASHLITTLRKIKGSFRPLQPPCSSGSMHKVTSNQSRCISESFNLGPGLLRHLICSRGIQQGAAHRERIDSVWLQESSCSWIKIKRQLNIYDEW